MQEHVHTADPTVLTCVDLCAWLHLFVTPSFTPADFSPPTQQVHPKRGGPVRQSCSLAKACGRENLP